MMDAEDVSEATVALLPAPGTRHPASWIATWIFAILPLLGWWLYGLFDLDEGFYGAVVAEMNRRGEWITPYFNGHPWFEKPVLLYWLAKPSVLLFGEWFGPRLPSILATIGTYLLIAWFARRRWGDHAARWCVLVAATSLLIVGVGRMMMTDALLDLCLVGAFVFFWESLAGDHRWRLLSAFFLGLSVLAKGPVGIILFLLVIAYVYWREFDLRPAFRGSWPAGIPVLVATIASWYVPAYLANGREFVHKFLLEQNLNRFTGGDPAHTLPFTTGLLVYPIVLFVGMAPWSFYLWKAWPRSAPSTQHPVSGEALDAQGSTALDRYLAVWAVVPFAFFMVSKAKLPHYVLPCSVPIALLVGKYLAARSQAQVPADRNWLASLRQLAYPIAVSIAAALVANAGFIYYYRQFHAEVHGLAFYVRDHLQPGEIVSAYQLPRREHELGTGSLRIQETSHPSLVMYLDRTVAEPDDIGQLLDHPEPEWVITRANRFTTADVDAIRRARRDISQVGTTARQSLYRLYYLTAAPGARTRR